MHIRKKLNWFIPTVDRSTFDIHLHRGEEYIRRWLVFFHRSHYTICKSRNRFETPPWSYKWYINIPQVPTLNTKHGHFLNA